MPLGSKLCFIIFMNFVSLPVFRGFLFENFEQSDCAHSQADILFLLDMSDDVTEQDFQKEKSFVIDFISHIDVKNQEYQVAVSSYSSRYTDIAYFNSVVDSTQLLDRIRSTTYKPGQRHLDSALSHVGGNFYHQRGARSFAAKIAFLITAGPGGYRYQDRVEHYASYIPSHYNVTLFVIAVSPYSHVPEVDIIARDRRHLFQIDNFSELSSISDDLLNTLCQDVIHGRSCYDTSFQCYRYGCSKSYYTYRCPKYCGLCTDSSTIVATSVPLTTTNKQTTRITTLPNTQQTQTVTSTKQSTSSVYPTTFTSSSVSSSQFQCQGSSEVCKDDPMAQCQQKEALFGICSTSNSIVIENCPVLCGLCSEYCKLKASKNGNGTTLMTNNEVSLRKWFTVTKT